MRPGQLVIVRKPSFDRGEKRVEGAAHLERRLNEGHGDGIERWSVRFLGSGDLAARSIRPEDVVDDPEDLDERMKQLELEHQQRQADRRRAGGAR